MVLSEEVSNRIILPGGELRLPDRDFVGEEVVAFFARYRAEFAIFGTAGVDEDGGLLEFHQAEVRATERLRQNSATSILVIDHSKFGRLAPAMGGNITDIDLVVCDRSPGEAFSPLVETMNGRIIFAEDNE